MSKHQKRIAAPGSWQISRKTEWWTVKPRPGPHPKDRSIPLLLILRDMLKLADNSKEAKRILNEGKVLVDGRIRKDHKFPVGIFDILSIPEIEANYMVLMDKRGKLSLHAISPEEAGNKLCRVENKRMLRGGVIQLNLHDGRNILLETATTEIRTHDSILLALNSNAISQHFAYKVGSKAMVLGGRHSAQIGEIEEIRVVRSPEPNVVILKSLEDGTRFETIEDYLFVVGEDEIAIPVNGSGGE